MTCACSSPNTKTYYAEIALFTHLSNGIPGGSAPPLSIREVTVCTECGSAEFLIPEGELRWFRTK
jgi:hypothetical protein